MRVLDAIHDQYQDGDVLLTHIGVKNASLNTCFLHQNWSVVSFENSPFKQVYTGHFHSTQQVGENLWDPGSLIPFKFDEGDVPHGFFVFDTETSQYEFVDIWEAGAVYLPDEVAPPQFYTIKQKDLEAFAPERINNNMIRISLERELSHDEKHMIATQLSQGGAKAVRWLNPKLRLPSLEESLANGLPIRQHANTDFFRIWKSSDSKNIAKLKLDEVLLDKPNEEIVHDGDEQYVVEEEAE